VTDDLKAKEESKRERHWHPLERWQIIQRTITWADAQRTVRRNTASACLAEETRKQSGRAGQRR